MRCVFCGAELPESAVFCASCGLEQPREAALPPQEEENEGQGFEPIPEKKNRKGRVLGIVALVLALFMLVWFASTTIIRLRERELAYQEAARWMDQGRAEDALAVFVQLGNYKKSAEYAETCELELKVLAALSFLERGEYESARELLPQLKGHAKAGEIAEGIQRFGDYYKALGLMEEEKYGEAAEVLKTLGSFENAYEKYNECVNTMQYEEALALLDDGKYEKAAEGLELLASLDFKNAKAMQVRCYNLISYEEAMAAYEAGEFYTAYLLFLELGNFEDSYILSKRCIQEVPAAGEVYRNEEYKKKTCPIRFTLYAPESIYCYVQIHKTDGTLVSSLFLHADKKVRVSLPAGTYIMETAYGVQWFGEKEMFGEIGLYQWAEFDGKTETRLQSGYEYTIWFEYLQGRNDSQSDGDSGNGFSA